MKAWAVFLVVGIVVLALVGWRIKANASEGEDQGGARGRRTPVVEAATARPATIEDTIEAVGSLESPNVVQLAPRSTGRIDFIEVREGDSVSAGQVLVRIDPAEAAAQVVQAEANLAQARSRLAEARLRQDPNSVAVSSRVEQEEANVDSAEAELERIKRNGESSIASARAGVSDAEAKVRGASSQVGNAQAVLKREQASLKNAETKLARTEDLYRQGYIAAQEVDDARTAVDVQKGNVAVAESQLAAAQQAKTSADSQLEVAKNQLAIAERTAGSDVKAAEARAVTARSALKVARANEAENPAFKENIAALAAAVDAARAQVELAKSNRDNMILSSPINGVVTSRTADMGSLASPGQAVLTVQSLEWLFFRSSLPIEVASMVKKGQSVQMSVDGIDMPVQGTVEHVNLAADPQSRQFSIQIKIENKDRRLLPGMFGRVKITTRKVDAKVTVPKEALTESDGKHTLVVVGQDMKTEQRTVEIGATDGTLVEVVSGVEPGERVVTLSFMPLRTGMTVEFAKPEEYKR